LLAPARLTQDGALKKMLPGQQKHSNVASNAMNQTRSSKYAEIVAQR